MFAQETGGVALSEQAFPSPSVIVGTFAVVVTVITKSSQNVRSPVATDPVPHVMLLGPFIAPFQGPPAGGLMVAGKNEMIEDALVSVTDIRFGAPEPLSGSIHAVI